MAEYVRFRAEQGGFEQTDPMPPGAMPPGAVPPGMMPPGAMHPGIKQPGIMTPGVDPPGISQPGLPPAKTIGMLGEITPLSRRVEGLAAAYFFWVAGFHQPVGDEVHIWRDKYQAWHSSTPPKAVHWIDRWLDNPDADPHAPTLAALHRELVPFLLCSPLHEAPEWDGPPLPNLGVWRQTFTVERASNVIKAFLVELVAEGEITITPDTVVTEVQNVVPNTTSALCHHVWQLIADKLWDPEWDWSQVRWRHT